MFRLAPNETSLSESKERLEHKELSCTGDYVKGRKISYNKYLRVCAKLSTLEHVTS